MTQTWYGLILLLLMPAFAMAQAGTPDDPLIIEIVKGPEAPAYTDLNEPTLAPIGNGSRVAEGGPGDEGFAYNDPFTWVQIIVLWRMTTEQAVTYMMAHPYRITFSNAGPGITKGRTWVEFVEAVLMEWTRYNTETIMGAEPETLPPGDVPRPTLSPQAPDKSRKLNFHIKSSKSCSWLINNNLDFHGRKRFAACRSEQWVLKNPHTGNFYTVQRKRLFTRKIPRYTYDFRTYVDEPCDMVYQRACYYLVYTGGY